MLLRPPTSGKLAHVTKRCCLACFKAYDTTYACAFHFGSIARYVSICWTADSDGRRRISVSRRMSRA